MPRPTPETERPPADTPRVERRRRYAPPRLEVVRALQEVVLGSSPGAGDSGGGIITEFPPGGGP